MTNRDQKNSPTVKVSSDRRIRHW